MPFTLKQSERSKTSRAIAASLASVESAAKNAHVTPASKLMLAIRVESSIYKSSTTLSQYAAEIANKLTVVKTSYVPESAPPPKAPLTRPTPKRKPVPKSTGPSQTLLVSKKVKVEKAKFVERTAIRRDRLVYTGPPAPSSLPLSSPPLTPQTLTTLASLSTPHVTITCHPPTSPTLAITMTPHNSIPIYLSITLEPIYVITSTAPPPPSPSNFWSTIVATDVSLDYDFDIPTSQVLTTWLRMYVGCGGGVVKFLENVRAAAMVRE